MQYETPHGRPRPNITAGGSTYPGRSGSSGRRRTNAGQPYHGPRGTQTRKDPGRLGGRGQGGYPLRSRAINFQRGRGGRGGRGRNTLILAAIAVLLLIVLVVGVSSCVRGCTASQESTGASSEVNPVDERVAYGVDEDLTTQFAVALDQGEGLRQIAANANRYEDTGLLTLALSEPDAISFVLAYPDAEKASRPYGETAKAGTAPKLFCWDSRWGNVEYAGRALALTGSGPVSLQMAYVGLTGKTDKTAADIAGAVAEAGQASGDSHMTSAFLTEKVKDLGIESRSYTNSADNITAILDTGTYLLMDAKAGTLTDQAHWVLLVTENADGSVVVYDPTSTAVSSRSWTPEELSEASEAFYALTLPSEDGEGEATE